MGDLSGKTALVTGSVQGIGLSIATALARAGARIAVHGPAGDAQIEQACVHLRKAGSPQAEYFNGNLRNADRIAELMASVAAWGGADILVTTVDPAATPQPGETAAAAWDRILALHLSAAFHGLDAALPLMIARGYGRVIMTSPGPSRTAAQADPLPRMAAHHGLLGLAQAATDQLGYGCNVIVQCLPYDPATAEPQAIAAKVVALCDPKAPLAPGA